MGSNYQILNVESLNDLFLDCRYLIKQRKILIFELNSTPYSTQMSPELKKTLAHHHLTIQILDLMQTKNLGLYQKLSTKPLIGYGIAKYDTLIVALLISYFVTHQSISTRQLRKFSTHLYYLNCTRQSPIKVLKTRPTALKIRQLWLRHGTFIDLKDYTKREPLKLAAAKNGLAIHYHRPLDHIRDQQRLNRYLAYSIGELLTIYDLSKLPSYLKAIQVRKELIQELKAAHSQLQVNLSTPLVSLVTAMVQPSKTAPEVISYQIPHVTRNLLDKTLGWTRKLDNHYQLNHQLTRHFLPIYNYYKNLQGLAVSQNNATKANLNLPFVQPQGHLTTNWIKLGKRFTSTNVNLAKLKTASNANFYVQSRRSGNWLINREYRTRLLPSKHQIDLSSLRVKFLAQLGLISFNPPFLSRRVITLLINLGTSQKLSSVIQNQFASAQIMWQLLLWKTGERLILNGNEISQTSINGFKLAKTPTLATTNSLRASFHFLLTKPFRNQITQIIPHLTQPQFLHKIQQMRKQLLDSKHFITALRFFQIIPKVGRWSHQILFTKGQNIRSLGTVTRLFLVKPSSAPVTIHVAKVTHAKWYRYNNDVNYHNQLIDQVERKGINGHVRQLRYLSAKQNVFVNLKSLKNFTTKERRYLYHQLDSKAYLKQFKSTEP